MSDYVDKRQNLYRQLEAHEDKLKSLEEQVLATQKLSTMGTMACIAAHEFNNLLTPIINYSELALKHPEDLALTQKTLEKIIKHGKQAASIVQSMLSVARTESKGLSQILLTDILDDCFQCLARDLGKDSIQTKLEIPENLTINVNHGQFQQLLLNLIINARQAMLQKGGTLTIAASIKDNTTEIRIKDTGCGMEHKVIRRIFEPFFSTKTNEKSPDRQGTGLGLMVCQTIIDNHNASIDVESSPGIGTIFTITIANAIDSQ